MIPSPQALLAALASAALLALCSCTPNTPAARIEQNPAAFASLSKSDKQAAQQGKIRRGMSKNGVFIAWGQPNATRQVNRGNSSYEDWIYTRTRPEYAGYGYGYYGPYYGRGYYRRSYYDPGIQTVWITYQAGRVRFRGGKVTEWSRSKMR